jgi:hypothetical protein
MFGEGHVRKLFAVESDDPEIGGTEIDSHGLGNAGGLELRHGISHFRCT